MQQQLEVNDKVFIKDEDHVWLPAKVIENNATDRILVEIDLPSDWVRTTATSSSSIKSSREQPQQQQQQQQQQLEQHSPLQGERRWVHLDDYKDRQLPLQNSNSSSSTTTATRDIAELPHLHEAAVLYQIKSRHVAKKPYTRVGDIVIALNPCQWIDKLYTAEQRHLYAKSFVWQVPDADTEEKKQDDRLSITTSSTSTTTTTTTTSATSTCFNSIYDKLGFEPHVYEVSALAYRGLFLDGKNQTILVSGESGAGKTETVKIVLKHLAGLETAALTPDSSEDDSIDSDALLSGSGGGGAAAVNGNDLVRRVVTSSAIFEAFGNAMTNRNHNSSRFGRMTRLHFATRENGMCGLQGSTSQTYLLETSRVVQGVGLGERNFHIFYQLLSAPSQVKRHLLGQNEMWEHAQPNHFKYLNEPQMQACLGRATDEEQWQETLRALDFVGWKRSKLETLARALGIILLLGNIVLVETPDGNGCVVSSLDDLILVAEALDIPVDVVDRAMTHQLIHDVEIKLHPEVAKDCLNALAKKIYACVFESVVSTVNERCTDDADIVSPTSGVINLLDIYGFECFENNRFEQLCINYANEKLHKKYVSDNFGRVQVEYEEQGIQTFDYRIIDNSAILEIFEGRSGLIGALNDECARKNGSSKDFVRKAKILHCSNERFISQKPHFHDAEFGVYHFAGPVIYDGSSFVERNTDKLPLGLLSMVANTSNRLIRDAFTSLVKEEEARIASDSGRKSATGRTVLEKFKLELKDLVASIEETQTRYIRCIKPNEKLSATSIDHSTVTRQLRWAGILAAIDLSRESFPSKLPFEVAEDRFMVLLKESQTHDMKDMYPQDRAQYMMSVLFAPLLEIYRHCDFTLPYATGTTMIYFRAGALELIEGLRHEYYSCRAAKIQRMWRRTTNGSRDFGRFKRSIILLQANARTFFAQRSFRRLKKAATAIRFMRRAHISERHHRYTRVMSAVKIQSTSRSWILSSRHRRMKCGFLRLQAQHRANLETKKWGDLLRAALLINSTCRAHVLKSRYRRLRNGCVLFQAQYRGVDARRCQAQARADIARAIQRERTCAAVRLMGVYQTAVARSRFCQMKSGFTRFQAQHRGVAERKRQDEYKKASTILSSSTRMYVHRVRNVRLVRATIIVQKWFRRKFHSNSSRNHTSTIATIQQVPVGETHEEGRRASSLAAAVTGPTSGGLEATSTQNHTSGNVATSISQQALVNISCQEEEGGGEQVEEETGAAAKDPIQGCLEAATTYISGNPATSILQQPSYNRSHQQASSEDSTGQESTCGGLEATNLQNPATHIVQQSSVNKPGQEEKGEEAKTTSTIKDDGQNQNQSHMQNNKGTDNAHKSNIESLEAQIRRLQNELECRNKLLAQEVAHVAEEAAIHTQEIEAEYEDRLAAYEEEVLQLKQELQETQESHETKIDRLMRDSYQQTLEYKNHLLFVSVQIEKAKEIRKAETDEILDQLQALKSEKNEQIRYLQSQLSLRGTMAPALTVASPGTDESEWSSSSFEQDPHVIRAVNEGGCISYLDEVEKLRRDLLTITATHNLVELVEKASCRPWQKDVHIERLCKSVESRVNKLGDLAIQRYMCEEPTVKHMHVDTHRSPSHVDVSRLPSPTSSLDDSSHET